MEESQHRDLILRSLIDEYLSDTRNQYNVIELDKVPLVINLIRTHQLLKLIDSPGPFTKPVDKPTPHQKEFYQQYQSHKQAIDKIFTTVEKLNLSKGAKKNIQIYFNLNF